MRGYGRTEAPERIDAYTVFHLVGDLVGILDALGQKDTVVVGHDWGSIDRPGRAFVISRTYRQAA